MDQCRIEDAEEPTCVVLTHVLQCPNYVPNITRRWTKKRMMILEVGSLTDGFVSTVPQGSPDLDGIRALETAG